MAHEADVLIQWGMDDGDACVVEVGKGYAHLRRAYPSHVLIVDKYGVDMVAGKRIETVLVSCYSRDVAIGMSDDDAGAVGANP